MKEHTEDQVNVSKVKNTIQWVVVILLSFCVGLGLNFALKPTTISGSSMYPTLEDGNRILLNSFQKDYKRGDIVVFHSPDDRLFVKRVVGLPGDHIEIADGSVYLNEQLLDEPYIHDVETFTDGEMTVPEDEYFVMGDNRGNSQDSRMIGTIHQKEMVGKLLVRILPLKSVDKSLAHHASGEDASKSNE